MCLTCLQVPGRCASSAQVGAALTCVPTYAHLLRTFAAVHDRCGVRLHVADRKHAVMQRLDLPGGFVVPALGIRPCLVCHASLNGSDHVALFDCFASDLANTNKLPACPRRLRPGGAVHHRPLRHAGARVPVGLPGVSMRAAASHACNVCSHKRHHRLLTCKLCGTVVR